MLQRSRIWFIRHGESTVNAASRQYRQQGLSQDAYYESRFFDPELTTAGREQAAAVTTQLQSELAQNALTQHAQLVIVSPMRRTLETATLAVLPVVGPPEGRTQWVALDSVREAMTGEVHVESGKFVPKSFPDPKPCNSRRPVSEVRTEFPHVDFSHCAEDDPLDPRESIEGTTGRVVQFVEWLKVWVEQQQAVDGDVQLDVVVVAHFVFLHRLFEQLGYGPLPQEKDGWTPSFSNCETRCLPLDEVLQIVAE